MKHKIKKLLSILLCLLFISSTFAATPSTISLWPKYDNEIYSKAAIVMDANSSMVLYSQNSEKKLYPASLAKIMTALIVFDKVENNFDDLVTFSYNSVTKDIDRYSVTIGASAGDQLTIKDCLYSLLLPSANDVANALAEHIAGSIDDFALLMNEKAKDLGLKNTHFVNPSGLHNDNQYTTAYDMAKILQCAIKNPMFLQISSSVSYRHAPIRKYKNPENSNNQVLNTNSIMVPGSGYYYKGITSGKTGHTESAGYNLASSAMKDDMHLICVVLGANSEKERFTDAKNLFDFHFDNYKSLSIKDTDSRFNEKIDTFSINDVDIIKTLNITCNEDAHITLPKNADINEVTSKITYQVKDIYNKYAIGYISYYYHNTLIGECTLEGRNITDSSSINFSHLNISKFSEDTNEDTANTQKNNASTNALIYRNQNGSIVISKTMITLIVLLVVFIVIIIGLLLFYTKILTNANFTLNKTIFKLKRYFKK